MQLPTELPRLGSSHGTRLLAEPQQGEEEPGVLGRAGTNSQGDAEDTHLRFPLEVEGQHVLPRTGFALPDDEQAVAPGTPEKHQLSRLDPRESPVEPGEVGEVDLRLRLIVLPWPQGQQVFREHPDITLSHPFLLSLRATPRARRWGRILHPGTCEMPTGSGGRLQRLQEALQRDVGEELPQGVPAPAVGCGDSGGRGGVVSARQGTSVWRPGHIWNGICRGMGSWFVITRQTGGVHALKAATLEHPWLSETSRG